MLLKATGLRCRRRISSRKSYSINVYNVDALNLDINDNIPRDHPCVIKGLTKSWKANVNWQPNELVRRYGDCLFECGVDDDESPSIIKLKDFVDNPFDKNGFPLYIFDSTFDVDCPLISNDYEIPVMFRDDILSEFAHNASKNVFGHNQISYKWLMIGHKYSGTKLHIDPLHSSAWNAVIYGYKSWFIASPSSNVLLGSYLDVYNNQVDEESTNASTSVYTNYQEYFSKSVKDFESSIIHDNAEVCKFIQGPGDIVYIPHDWIHSVCNLTFTVAVTHNFIEMHRANELFSSTSSSATQLSTYSKSVVQ